MWEGGGIMNNFFMCEMIVNKYKNDKIKKSMWMVLLFW